MKMILEYEKAGGEKLNNVQDYDVVYFFSEFK